MITFAQQRPVLFKELAHQMDWPAFVDGIEGTWEARDNLAREDIPAALEALGLPADGWRVM